MTPAERDELLVTLLNAHAEESRRKHEALAKLLELQDRRIARLERKMRKRK